MSDLAAAMADTSKLSDYRGRMVLAVSARLTNAGDGLSKAQAITPVELEIGETVYVLYEAVVQKHNHEPIDKDNPRGPLRLDLVLKAGTATVVDKSFAEEKIVDQATLIREATERAKGIAPLGASIAEDEKAARGRKTPPPAPVADGPTDGEGFHDPALGAAAKPAKKAAKKGVLAALRNESA